MKQEMNYHFVNWLREVAERCGG